jgi:hypothetical protein
VCCKSVCVARVLQERVIVLLPPRLKMLTIKTTHPFPHSDREFAGFGLASDKYCDCFLDAEQLPVDDIKVGACLLL